MRRRRFNRRGASAIEFGLTLPVLLIICSAVIEYGMVFFQQSALIGAARDGTRYGATVDTDDDPEGEAEDRAREVLTGYGLDCSNALTCDVTAELDFDGTNNFWFLRVSIERVYEPVLDLLPTPNYVRAEMVMLIEDQVIP
ncbi:MAG: pilus assembly protein [Alphaproteobacteria bacterium]|nr:pilus assembly protein [Alphaproteobacteria bacterium]